MGAAVLVSKSLLGLRQPARWQDQEHGVEVGSSAMATMSQ